MYAIAVDESSKVLRQDVFVIYVIFAPVSHNAF